ncbi:MAG: flagellar hook-basal body complex protein, partial [Alicyclobacillus macrosporangiidus]|uniref:flagellar hook-basal body complex protein n=1 Tax=Alicyclobacillus macrosporangiidus TaxID=392015 RepID=UPI0026F1DC90
MLRSMYSAVSGMQGFQTKLDVIGNNIANVNTPGFKSGRVDFADVLSQTLSGGSAPATTGGTNAAQVGLGVRVVGIDNLFTQGAPQSTGVPTDLAINGDGFFVVTDSTSGGTQYLTRAGNFTLDASGNLVLPDGKIAMGYQGSTQPSPPLGAPSPVNVSSWVPAGGTLADSPDVQIGPDGAISVMVDNGGTLSRQTVGYLALATVANPGGLNKVGDTQFVVGTNSGPLKYHIPGSDNTGTLASGYLEMSNVDLTREFTEMIVAQRGFDANS